MLRVEVRLSAGEMAEAAGISVERLARLVHLGVVEPGADGYSVAALARLRRLLRLRRDLGMRMVDAAIVLDLVTRIERLERDLARLHATRGSTY